MVLLIAGLVALLAIGWGVHFYERGLVGERKMTELLSGKGVDQFSSIDITSGYRAVHCTDKEALDYLSDAIMRHSKRGGESGGVYTATIKFAGGGKFTTEVYFQTTQFALSMPSHAMKLGFPSDDVQLAEPMPSSVSAMVQFLTEPREKTAGKALILESRKLPLTQDDPSLGTK